MSDVNVVVEINDEDEFHPNGIFVLTINGTPIGVTTTSYGWTTGTLVYAEGLALTIVVTNNPPFYQDKTLNTIASEGTETISLTLTNPTISAIWSLTIGATTLGFPVIKVDDNVITDIATIDGVNQNDIVRIDGIYIADGTWNVDIRSRYVGLTWQVTITA